MANAAAPSSCLLHLRHGSPPPRKIPLGALRFREIPRYAPGILLLRRRTMICRGLDEEGYFVQEDQDRIHPRYPFSHQFNPVDERTTVTKLVDALEKLTPAKTAAFATAVSILWTLTDCLSRKLLLNPSLWASASRLLVFWPWLAALLTGAATCSLAYKRLKRWPERTYSDNERDIDGVMLLAGALVWLILVPFGHFQGYVDGYPVIFYAAYMTYFLYERVIREVCFERYYPAPPEKDWIIPVDKASWIGFLGCVIAGHWLAAFEAPPLIRSWNLGWPTWIAGLMASAALALKYHGTFYLLKHSKTVDQPKKTVWFAAYRWVRHPIYGSSMLLFSALCMAVRAYGSLALIMAGCLFYYEQLTKREEELLLRKFGETYAAYRKKVRNKYVPYLF